MDTDEREDREHDGHPRARPGLRRARSTWVQLPSPARMEAEHHRRSASSHATARSTESFVDRELLIRIHGFERDRGWIACLGLRCILRGKRRVYHLLH